ncbi:MAG TPA: archaetidylserine decarboxylase [Thermoanaerobaculia bacterium]|nr:archaetidylserine decarboxylase [Thermoanaerobaculia bacterium]
MDDPRKDSGPVTRGASAGDRLRAVSQWPLPQHALSRLVLRVTRSRRRWLKSLLIRRVVAGFDVDLSDAAQPDLAAYGSFNDFFTRPLAAGARPLPTSPQAIASPVDGVVSQAGAIGDGRIFQAKGREFTVQELLGGAPQRALPFHGGHFATLYLSPRDYHRIHMPVAGRLIETVHVPGRLFSVDARTTRAVPRLFARNERVVAIFDSAAGPMAVVMVGALFVSAVETVWQGLVTPPSSRWVRSWYHGEDGPSFARGDEIARFNMGSTVILLFAPGRVAWSRELAPEALVRMGGTIGNILPAADGSEATDRDGRETR